ncbi:hypothetical protein VQ02_13845 [Methylobacterium variabile]|uniref:Uncharacterized protein n=1 Tax=Methylobacterium variabile TaxID=298794 RepID=A0A0J6SUM7_9HYPH|nr:hypothetical protein [Methylobacterium variabile]KMO37237.1 hypothetical protein VQ02_13845 [Methylobacterium variabile]
MSPPPITVTVLLRQIADWLTDAAALARAAATCAESGSEAEAVRLSLDLDERLHEAEGLHCAVRLIARLQADGPLPADASGLGIVLDAQPRSGDVPVRGSGRWRRPVSPPEARTSTMTHLTETQRRLIEAATHIPTGSWSHCRRCGAGPSHGSRQRCWRGAWPRTVGPDDPAWRSEADGRRIGLRQVVGTSDPESTEGNRCSRCENGGRTATHTRWDRTHCSVAAAR